MKLAGVNIPDVDPMFGNFAVTMKSIILALICAILFSSCSTGMQARVSQEVFGRPEIERQVLGAKNVKATRLRWKGAGLEPSLRGNRFNTVQITSYDIESEVMLTPQQVGRLRRLLRTPSSYQFAGAKPCIPEFGVMFTFDGDVGSIRLLLCFNCSVFGLYDGESFVNREADFDGMFNSLLDLSNELFPGDAELKSTKPRPNQVYLKFTHWLQKLLKRDTDFLLPPLE